MKFVNIILFVVCTICFSACSLVESFVSNVCNNIPLDNNGSTYHNYSQDEAMDIIMNTREAKAWNESSASRGLLISEGILEVGEYLSGKDFSVARGIMRSTVDDLISDRNSGKGEKAQLIGAAFYGAGHIADHIEQQNISKYNQGFIEDIIDKECEDEPYCDCFYRIGENGRYEDVRKKYGMAEVQKCIRQQQQDEAQQIYKEALALCAPTITQNYLDELAGGSEKDKNERHRIIFEALRCYNQYKYTEIAAKSEVTSDVVDDMAIDEFIEILDDATYSDSEDENNEPDSNLLDIITKTDKEVLEGIKIDSYKFNSYNLSEESKIELDKAVEILLKNEKLKIVLLGHSCNVGTEEANYIIGIQRAKVVKKYLVEKGVDAKRISVHSMGSKRPIVTNESPSNRALNRRVEFVIIK